MSNECYRKWIFAKRNEYKTKELTPKSLLWIWEEENKEDKL